MCTEDVRFKLISPRIVTNRGEQLKELCKFRCAGCARVDYRVRLVRATRPDGDNFKKLNSHVVEKFYQDAKGFFGKDSIECIFGNATTVCFCSNVSVPLC